jgi:hypothetical protein
MHKNRKRHNKSRAKAAIQRQGEETQLHKIGDDRQHSSRHKPHTSEPYVVEKTYEVGEETSVNKLVEKGVGFFFPSSIGAPSDVNPLFYLSLQPRP